MSVLSEFKEFAVKGNAMDMAVGIILGVAFKDIVDSLVRDILMPPIGLLINRVNFTELYVDLSGGDYPSLEAAQAAAAPTINYGIFINQLLQFVIMAFVLFLIVRQMNRLRTVQGKVKAKVIDHRQFPRFWKKKGQ